MNVEEEHRRWVDQADELPWNDLVALGMMKRRSMMAFAATLRSARAVAAGSDGNGLQ